MKNNFEHTIKETLENQEVPYEPGAWERFEKNLTPSTPFYKSKWFIGGVTAFIVTALVVMNVDFNSTDSSIPLLENDSNEITQLEPSNKDSNPNEVKISLNSNLKEKSKEKKIKNQTSTVSNSNKSKFYNTSGINKENTSASLENKQSKADSIISTQGENSISDSIEKAKVEVAGNNNPTESTNESIEASFYIEKTICQGNTINLIAENTQEDYEYNWILNDSEFIKGQTVSIESNKTGINTVVLIIKQKEVEIARKEKTFEVIEAPTDNVEISSNEFSLINELKFEMENLSNQIVWDFGDGTTSTNSSEVHTFSKAGKYICKYSITSSNGCMSIFKRNINVKGYYNLREDYGFSPNNDNRNDVFIPVELKEINSPFVLNIYARNGQLIYTTTTISKPWNGKLKDGSTCPFGSYVWTLSLTNKQGENELYKGTVTNVSN